MSFPTSPSSGDTYTTPLGRVYEFQSTGYWKDVGIAGSFVPLADITYDIGTSAKRWRNAYLEQLRLPELTANGTNYTALKGADAQSADTVYTLPDAYPAADGYTLVSTTAGVMSWTNPSSVVLPTTVAISSDQHDYPFDASGIIVFDNTGNNSLTGVVAQANGTGLRIVNIGSGTLTFKKEDAGSVAANRMAGGANQPIGSGEAKQLIYSSDLSRWISFI